MNNPAPLPLIGLPADFRELDGQDFHVLGDKYARAVAVAANAMPVMLPALADVQNAENIVERLDGLLLTGSRSNVHPQRYGTAPTAAAEPYDEVRDASAFALIRAALDHEIPLLAICRGIQELNAALGGTLHARLHEMSDRLDHRRPEHDDPDVQYGLQHPVQLTANGPLATLIGRTRIDVNSLHWQGIDRIAPALDIEATAPDGTIEAVHVRDAQAFALGVQWHPEYKVMENPVSVALFHAFGDAARARVIRKQAA